MKKYLSVKAICPFYKHKTKQVISCVGVIEGTVLHFAFANATKAKEHKKTKCKQSYTECPIYKMLKQQQNN